MYADCTSTEAIAILCWDIRDDNGLTQFVMATGSAKEISQLKRHAKKHSLPTIEEVKAGKTRIELT